MFCSDFWIECFPDLQESIAFLSTSPVIHLTLFLLVFWDSFLLPLAKNLRDFSPFFLEKIIRATPGPMGSPEVVGTVTLAYPFPPHSSMVQ